MHLVFLLCNSFQWRSPFDNFHGYRAGIYFISKVFPRWCYFLKGCRLVRNPHFFLSCVWSAPDPAVIQCSVKSTLCGHWVVDLSLRTPDGLFSVYSPSLSVNIKADDSFQQLNYIRSKAPWIDPSAALPNQAKHLWLKRNPLINGF